MKALFDADILVFRAGFAAEKNKWYLSVPKPCQLEGGEPFKGTFQYKKDAISKLDRLLPGINSREEGVDYQLYAERELEPLENALHNVNVMVARALADCDCSEDDVEMYLSGGVNFRYEVAKTQPYKANRNKAHRPQYEKQIRKYIESKWPTTVTDGIEADDALGMAQCTYGPYESVIISIDKDLDMIPGLKYNIMHELNYDITEEEAWKKFCLQVLTGDSTDNIPGLPRIGAKKAEKMLDGLDHTQWLEEVARQYASKSGREDWWDYMTEQAQLIWIWRENKMFEFPEELRELGGYDDIGEINASLL